LSRRTHAFRCGSQSFVLRKKKRSLSFLQKGKSRPAAKWKARHSTGKLLVRRLRERGVICIEKGDARNYHREAVRAPQRRWSIGHKALLEANKKEEGCFSDGQRAVWGPASGERASLERKDDYRRPREWRSMERTRKKETPR